MRSLAFLATLLLCGFALKTLLKDLTASPRPYVEWLVSQQHLLNTEQFYQLTQPKQLEVISQVSQTVSPWRTVHWQYEMDYAFPSGHTLFASICIVFFGQQFLQARRYISASLLLFWGWGVTTSRLWIGMHRPEDLFGAMVVVFITFAILDAFYRAFWNKIKRDA